MGSMLFLGGWGHGVNVVPRGGWGQCCSWVDGVNVVSGWMGSVLFPGGWGQCCSRVDGVSVVPNVLFPGGWGQCCSRVDGVNVVPGWMGSMLFLGGWGQTYPCQIKLALECVQQCGINIVCRFYSPVHSTVLSPVPSLGSYKTSILP